MVVVPWLPKRSPVIEATADSHAVSVARAWRGEGWPRARPPGWGTATGHGRAALGHRHRVILEIAFLQSVGLLLTIRHCRVITKIIKDSQ